MSFKDGQDHLAGEQIRGTLHISPGGIICSAEPLTPKMCETITQAFGIEPLTLYAASESIAIAAQCASRHRFHLFDDWHCCEILDRNHDPVKAGEFGNLILTNLYNYTQPLIRYRMDDELTLDKQPCDCGWPFQAVRDVDGREEDFLWFEKADGGMEFIHPIVFVEFMVSGLAGMQVVQKERNRLVLKAIIAGNVSDTIERTRERMTSILQKKNLHDTVVLDVQVVDAIGHDPGTGKFKLIIPLKADSAGGR